MGRSKSKGDVSWYIHGRKTPFLYSTVAARDLLRALAEIYPTVREVAENVNYDVEAKKIAYAFVEKGYGDEPSVQVFGS